jgi:hypothetical protein
LGPRFGIIGIAFGSAPQDGPALIGKVARERAVKPDKAIPDKPGDFRTAQSAHRFIGGHQKFSYRQPMPAGTTNPNKKGAPPARLLDDTGTDRNYLAHRHRRR